MRDVIFPFTSLLVKPGCRYSVRKGGMGGRRRRREGRKWTEKWHLWGIRKKKKCELKSGLEETDVRLLVCVFHFNAYVYFLLFHSLQLLFYFHILSFALFFIDSCCFSGPEGARERERENTDGEKDAEAKKKKRDCRCIVWNDDVQKT